MSIVNSNEFFPIPSLNNRYFVNAYGDIKSYLRNTTGKLLKQQDYYGYKKVLVRPGDGRSRMVFVHRLVAEVFLRWFIGAEINHIDGNKGNNSVDNLEWVTHQRNIDHCYEIGLRKKEQKRLRAKYVKQDESAKFNVKAISSQDAQALYKITPSCRKIAKMLGVSHETVRQALKIKHQNYCPIV